MNEFKVGDKVICVDDKCSGIELEHGKMYVVSEVDSYFFIKMDNKDKFWDNSRFELYIPVSPDHTNTVVGQKVRVKTSNLNSTSAGQLRGQICTVKEIAPSYLRLEEEDKDKKRILKEYGGLHWNEIEFIEGEDMPISDTNKQRQAITDTSSIWHDGSKGYGGSGGLPRTPQEEIDFLLKLANEGRSAVTKLQKLCPNRVELYSLSENWVLATHVHEKSLYRIKPQPKMETWYTNGSDKWKVNTIEDGKKIRIGCKIFSVEGLRYILNAMVANNYPSAAHNEINETFYATKMGIKLDQNTLLWADAERLLTELKKLEIT